MNQSYLDQLPDVPRVTKVHTAVSEFDNQQAMSMHHVPLGDVQRWEARFSTQGNYKAHQAVRLARGCSALGRHQMLHNALKQIGLQHLVHVRKVRTIAMETLLRRHRASSVGMLALDCEG